MKMGGQLYFTVFNLVSMNQGIPWLGVEPLMVLLGVYISLGSYIPLGAVSTIIGRGYL